MAWYASCCSCVSSFLFSCCSVLFSCSPLVSHALLSMKRSGLLIVVSSIGRRRVPATITRVAAHHIPGVDIPMSTLVGDPITVITPLVATAGEAAVVVAIASIIVTTSTVRHVLIQMFAPKTGHGIAAGHAVRESVWNIRIGAIGVAQITLTRSSQLSRPRKICSVNSPFKKKLNLYGYVLVGRRSWIGETSFGNLKVSARSCNLMLQPCPGYEHSAAVNFVRACFEVQST